jgi:nucleoside-diphosphate-sugar epimerase
MKYLILGSEGQIGRHLTKFLEGGGHEVIPWDIVNCFSEDLRDQANNTSLRGAMEECDFVFFLAFDVGGSRYLNQYQHTYDFMHNNMAIMNNTFKILSETKKPFIFTSTQMSKMDFSPYGRQKQIGEEYTRLLNGVVVSLWNVYGVEKDEEKSHVITDFIKKAKTGNIDMYTDGQEHRDFLHADDCSRALKILSDNYHDLDRDKDLHIYYGEWTKIIDVAKMVSDITPCEILPSDRVDTVQNSVKVSQGDYIKDFWEPRISLKEGIMDMCNAYS